MVSAILNNKNNKMNESIIIQKMISIGQHLEREEIFYSGAEADARALLEEIKQALTIPVVFDNVRCSVERTSIRNRQCYGTGKKIAKGDKYINHQFRYDGRIITVSFCKDYFNGC